MYLCVKSASGLWLYSTLFLLTLSFCISVMQLIIPGLKTAHCLWGSLSLLCVSLFLPLSLSLSLSHSSLLLLFPSPANWRQPHCQFHARVVSSAAEIIHCKIDLNNRKVEQQGKAGEWNCESLLPFWTCFMTEKELGCIAYRECQQLESWYRHFYGLFSHKYCMFSVQLYSRFKVLFSLEFTVDSWVILTTKGAKRCFKWRLNCWQMWWITVCTGWCVSDAVYTL